MEHLRAWWKAEHGRLKLLSKRLGLRSTTVCEWRRVPLTHLYKVRRITKIPLSQLRPDFDRR